MMIRRNFRIGMMALCGVAVALMLPGHAHAENLIGTGVVGVSLRVGPPQNVHVLSGDEQTGEAIAAASTGIVAAGLYNDTWVMLTPDASSVIATLYPADPANANVFSGTIRMGSLAGARVTTELVGELNELQWAVAIDVQWSGGEVQWETVDTTISSYSPD